MDLRYLPVCAGSQTIRFAAFSVVAEVLPTLSSWVQASAAVLCPATVRTVRPSAAALASAFASVRATFASYGRLGCHQPHHSSDCGSSTPWLLQGGYESTAVAASPCCSCWRLAACSPRLWRPRGACRGETCAAGALLIGRPLEGYGRRPAKYWIGKLPLYLVTTRLYLVKC